MHEISHSYCNHLIEKNFDKLEKSGEAIFPIIEYSMRSQAYTKWMTVLCEALVRASTINYAQKDTVNLDAQQLIGYEKSRSFFWIDDLVKGLSSYDQNRTEYPTLESYMPKIVTYYDKLADKARNITLAKVESASIKNDSKIDSSISELIFRFNKPMRTRGFGFNKAGKEFPKMKKTEWVDDRTLRIEIDLEKGKEYAIQLFLGAFADAEGFPLTENHLINFDTLE